jgi:chloramphenicol-sensitive protein RarD
LLNNKFSKGVIFSCIAAIFWGLPQPLFFNELNHVETIEVVAHRGFWSFIFLFLLLILISNISDFIEIFKSRKRIFILTITAFLITGNWAGFIYSVGQERVQDASMGYFITPMISIILGYFFLNEKITKPKFASVCLMFLGILFLFINLKQFPFLIIWIGTSWAIYGLLRKQVNVNPPIGLLYETFIISLISTPYLVYLFWQNENSIFSIDLKTSLFLILTGAVTIFPLLFFNLGLKFIQLGLAGVLFYLAPTFHFITSVFILNEEILQIKLVSFIIIWIGIIIYIYDSYKKEIILNNTQ